MPEMTAAPAGAAEQPPLSVRVHLCVTDAEEHLLPKRRRAPHYLPVDAPLPRVGEVVYLSSSSAWGVTMVIHSWRAPRELRIEVWLEYVGEAGHPRKTGFGTTQ